MTENLCNLCKILIKKTPDKSKSGQGLSLYNYSYNMVKANHVIHKSKELLILYKIA